MARYHFIGRVHPERCYLTINGVTLWAVNDIQGPEPTNTGKIRSTIGIDNAQIHVVIDEPPDWLVANGDDASLKNLVAQLASQAVDAASFTHGRGYDVEIVSGWKEGQMAKTYGIEIPEVAQLAKDAAVDFGKLFEESVRTPELARALADFREAIRSPSATAFHCERALENLARHFSGGRQAERAHWSKMGDALQIDKTVKDEIHQRSNEPRHGGSEAISQGDRVRLLSLTFQVIDRFFTYRQGGDQPLDVGRIQGRPGGPGP